MYIRKIKTLLKLIVYAAKSFKGVEKAGFYNAVETVDIALYKRVSIIRLGDGEFNILNGISVSYQKCNDQLQREMEKLILDYIEGNGRYLLCMPGEFLNVKGNALNLKQLKSWAFSRYYFKKKFDVNVTYGDAFLFAKGNEMIYSRIWKESKADKVVFVHNDSSYAVKFANKYGIETEFVKVPKRNAYSQIREIEQSIRQISSTDTLILISAGPATKVIIKHLSFEGFWCIDTGHCWDLPLLLRNK